MVWPIRKPKVWSLKTLLTRRLCWRRVCEGGQMPSQNSDGDRVWPSLVAGDRIRGGG
jgi:hypothetical protein